MKREIRRGTFVLLLGVLALLTGCARTTAGPAPVEQASSTPVAVSTNWWQEAVFYEIFVRSFYDTDGDGIGDLNGVAQKLDYLESLGITALWLMPIHPSPSYHGYDVLDYYDVHPQYGTLQDFKNLLEQAHKRDIRIIIDLVFSLDSIITAIGMAQDLEIMIAAVIIAVIVMYVSAVPVTRFVSEHPTTKMLALAFLVLIGVALVADGFHFHIPRAYIYFAMAFSAAVEMFNVLARRNREKAGG
jgi:hypothetical protein